MTPPSVSEQIKDLWKKANESVQAAQELLDLHHEEFAVSRAYYGMFYITEAVLLTKALSFSKHSAVIATFGQHFIKTGIFRPELREMLTESFEDRTVGDYGMSDTFSTQDAQEIVQRAKSYCEELEKYLKEKGHLN